MIVVSDTTPLISLLKISRLDLLEKLFGEVLIPSAVFNELTTDERFQLEANQIRQEKFIVVNQLEDTINRKVKECIDGLKRAGRHIGQRHYHILLSRLND